MNHNEKKMVDAIASNNPSEFANAFKDTMKTRVAQKLDDERVQVARDIVKDNNEED